MTDAAQPVALFDTRKYFTQINDYRHLSDHYSISDIEKAFYFLKAYRGSQGTFNSYRREIERLIHWCTLIVHKTFSTLKSDDIENFILFCQNPPKHWIGVNKPPRFIMKDGERLPNPAWRPFAAKLSKTQRRKGVLLTIDKFELANESIKELFAILSSFYNYLLQEEYVMINPVALVRQKSKFLRKRQGKTKVRRLSNHQWRYVIESARTLAKDNPAVHARTLFIISALYLMYLRISELVASDRWLPKMNDFYRDHENAWWFTTVGKGNKERTIAVSPSMLEALKAWREHLNLPILPSLGDHSPLLPKMKGKGAIKSINHIRNIVQYCFDHAIERLRHDNLHIEAETLTEATVHWLRHTGISDDVKIRPREHVRDDAGHASSATTDKYIDIDLYARYQSATKKEILLNTEK
jgi:site-specific recombinase XerD